MNIKLKAAIIEAGFNQLAFSRICEISELRLSQIIHQRAVPTDAEQQRLAEALGVPVDVLFPETR